MFTPLSLQLEGSHVENLLYNVAAANVIKTQNPLGQKVWESDIPHLVLPALLTLSLASFHFPLLPIHFQPHTPGPLNHP